MVTLDIVIDPLALRGYRWFLGQIYGYPEPGVYFGVTLSNFGGWFLVALGLIRVLQLLITRAPPSPWWDWGRRRFPSQALLGPGSLPGHPGLQPDHDLPHRGDLPGLGGDLHLPALPELAGPQARPRQPAIKATGPSRPWPAARAAPRLRRQRDRRSRSRLKSAASHLRAAPTPTRRPLVPGSMEKFRDLLCGRVGNGPEAQKGQTLSRGHLRQGAGFQVQNRPRQTGQRFSLTSLVDDAAGGDQTAGDRGEPRLLQGAAEARQGPGGAGCGPALSSRVSGL